MWVNPKSLSENDMRVCHLANAEIFHVATALALKDYFDKTNDEFVVLVKDKHYPSIKGVFKEDERIVQVILLGV